MNNSNIKNGKGFFDLVKINNINFILSFQVLKLKTIRFIKIKI
jgi:hypothetical protein